MNTFNKIRITKYNGVMFMFKDSNNDIVVTLEALIIIYGTLTQLII
jgi:hypothetical protein